MVRHFVQTQGRANAGRRKLAHKFRKPVTTVVESRVRRVDGVEDPTSWWDDKVVSVPGQRVSQYFVEVRVIGNDKDFRVRASQDHCRQAGLSVVR